MAAMVDSTPLQDNEAPPAIADYLSSPNAVLGDKIAQWRYGRAPDYTKTRKVWAESKQANHAEGSLEQLVENLVKNWEIEASFKTCLADWRTVDHEKYTFAINGGPPQSGEHMLKVGTYNAIISPNEYYSPANSDFASSHKTFKRMMPTFAWEVLEVYSGPPRVAFKWRHWGTFKNDYVGFNDKGEKVTAKAHGGIIDIKGITIATVDDKVRLQQVDTYFDPMDMFRQIAPEGIINKQPMNAKVASISSLDPQTGNDGVKIGNEHNHPRTAHSHDAAPHASGEPRESETDDKFAHVKPVAGAQQIVNVAAEKGAEVATQVVPSNSTEVEDRPFPNTNNGPQNEAPSAPNGTKCLQSRDSSAVAATDGGDTMLNGTAHSTELDEKMISDQATTPATDADTQNGDTHAGFPDAVPETVATAEDTAKQTNGHAAKGRQNQSSATEGAICPVAGQAFAAPKSAEETRRAHEEMSRITPTECPFLMNRE